jgi:hypothetical protein
MNKHVFFDLEGTVIDDIDNQNIVNDIPTIRKWLEGENVLSIGIFSFAIDNKEERDTFMRQFTRRTLESLLKVDIGRVVTTEDAMAAAVSRNRTVRFEGLWEFKQLWGKERGFIDFAFQNFTNAEVVLLDDMVTDQVVFFPRKSLTIRLVNVNTLSGNHINS